MAGSRGSRLKKVSATGDVSTSRGYLRSIVLTPAAALSTLDVRVDGSGGTVICSLQAAASGASAIFALEGSVFFTTLHATLSGSGASATFEYSST